jgi:hypothetical protein
MLPDDLGDEVDRLLAGRRERQIAQRFWLSVAVGILIALGLMALGVFWLVHQPSGVMPWDGWH